ncbi:hypothetical protein H0H92_007088 [Tricholoma furcatifolium]|nr:hypothetical protein H0H92_007088 [Tricholoma furcatifolium]
MPDKKQAKKGRGAADYGGLDPELMREMDALLQSTSRLDLNNKSGVDLSSYNYASLAKTIRHESFWVLQLEHMGSVDKAGRPIPDEEVRSTPGACPIFTIYCYDDKERIRVTR